MRTVLILACLLLAAGRRAEADIPQAVVMLEEPVPGRAGQVPEAAPARFVLLEDGQLFVGGSSEILTTRLSARELKDFDKRLAELRKHPALAGNVALGPGGTKRRLVLRKGSRPLDMVLTGDLESATPAMRGLADFVAQLGRYHHPALTPYAPTSFALSAREGALPGGCRRWTHAEALKDAVFAPKVVPSAGLESWPRGANPAYVCAGDKGYVVTLRPLLPGERP
jgi:hypothetical protein